MNTIKEIREIKKLSEKGKSNFDIAAKLNLKIGYVKKVVENIEFIN